MLHQEPEPNQQHDPPDPAAEQQAQLRGPRLGQIPYLCISPEYFTDQLGAAFAKRRAHRQGAEAVLLADLIEQHEHLLLARRLERDLAGGLAGGRVTPGARGSHRWQRATATSGGTGRSGDCGC